MEQADQEVILTHAQVDEFGNSEILSRTLACQLLHQRTEEVDSLDTRPVAR